MSLYKTRPPPPRLCICCCFPPGACYPSAATATKEHYAWGEGREGGWRVQANKVPHWPLSQADQCSILPLLLPVVLGWSVHPLAWPGQPVSCSLPSKLGFFTTGFPTGSICAKSVWSCDLKFEPWNYWLSSKSVCAERLPVNWSWGVKREQE